MVDSSIALLMMNQSLDGPARSKASLRYNWQAAIVWPPRAMMNTTRHSEPSGALSVLTAMLLLRFGYSRSQNG